MTRVPIRPASRHPARGRIAAAGQDPGVGLADRAADLTARVRNARGQAGPRRLDRSHRAGGQRREREPETEPETELETELRQASRELTHSLVRRGRGLLSEGAG